MFDPAATARILVRRERGRLRARVARWTSSATGSAASRCRCRRGRGMCTRTCSPAKTAGRSSTPGSGFRTRRRPGRPSSSRRAAVSRPSSSRTSTPTTSEQRPTCTSSPARPSSRASSTTRSASSCGGTRCGRSGCSSGSGSTALRPRSPRSSSGRAPSTGRSSATSATRSSSTTGSTSTGGSSSRRPATPTGSSASSRDGVLVAADHLLGRITPTVGLWPASRPDPLGDYLAALDRTIELDPRIALPGHGDPIEDPAGRARELQAHHAERLERDRRGARRGATDGLRAVAQPLRRGSQPGGTPLRDR